MKIYVYSKCGTCRKALKFLDHHKIQYRTVPIRETPPSKTELKRMLTFQGGNVKKLFNTSGLDYKKLNLKEKLQDLSMEEALELLSRNGNLIKRPFLLTDKMGLVGFQEDQWKHAIRFD